MKWPFKNICTVIFISSATKYILELRSLACILMNFSGSGTIFCAGEQQVFFDGFTSYSDPRFIQTVILQHLLLFLKGFEQRIYLFLCFIFVFFLNLFIFWIVRSWLWTTRGFVHMYIMEKNQIYNKKKHTEDSHGMQLHGGRVRLQEELSFGTCSAPCTASPWNCTQFNVTFSTAV